MYVSFGAKTCVLEDIKSRTWNGVMMLRSRAIGQNQNRIFVKPDTKLLALCMTPFCMTPWAR
jgi:hypothetical protein